jgi:hypothetical protein
MCVKASATNNIKDVFSFGGYHNILLTVKQKADEVNIIFPLLELANRICRAYFLILDHTETWFLALNLEMN